MNMQPLEALKERLSYDAWKNSSTLAENLFIWQYFLDGKEFPGWRVHRMRQDQPVQWPRAIQSIWQPAEDENEGLFSLDIYECASRAAAHELLLQVLAEFQSAEMTRQEPDGVGDVAFAMAGNTTLLYARGNLLALFRNAARQMAPIPDLADQFDKYLTGRPELEGTAVTPEIQRFEPTAKEIEAGRDVPLEVDASDPLGRPVWYKFFADKGEVLAEDGTLYYRPAEAGPQTVTLYVLNANDGAASQELQLNAA